MKHEKRCKKIIKNTSEFQRVKQMLQSGKLVEVFAPTIRPENKELVLCPGCSQTHQILHLYWKRSSLDSLR